MLYSHKLQQLSRTVGNFLVVTTRVIINHSRVASVCLPFWIRTKPKEPQRDIEIFVFRKPHPLNFSFSTL